MSDLNRKRSIVQTIWSDPDLILLIFAGAAAEFALNRAVDWLFFTGRIPADPIGRFFVTVSHAQEIVFADEQKKRAIVERINAVHRGLERAREQKIPEWAFRDVLYMLVDYTERSFELLYRPLRKSERDKIYKDFLSLGELMNISGLPANHNDWLSDRRLHLNRDLEYSRLTANLYEQYRKQLGEWRYRLLLDVQALIVPHRVRRLLGLSANNPLSYVIWTYNIASKFKLQTYVRRALLPAEHFAAVERLSR